MQNTFNTTGLYIYISVALAGFLLCHFYLKNKQRTAAEADLLIVRLTYWGTIMTIGFAGTASGASLVGFPLISLILVSGIPIGLAMLFIGYDINVKILTTKIHKERKKRK